MHRSGLIVNLSQPRAAMQRMHSLHLNLSSSTLANRYGAAAAAATHFSFKIIIMGNKSAPFSSNIPYFIPSIVVPCRSIARSAELVLQPVTRWTLLLQLASIIIIINWPGTEEVLATEEVVAAAASEWVACVDDNY